MTFLNDKQLILLLLESNNKEKIHGKSRLTKIIYLINKEMEHKERKYSKPLFDDFNFVLFEPSSQKLDKKIKELIENNLIIKGENIEKNQLYKEKIYSISPIGEREIENINNKSTENVRVLVNEVKKCYNDMPLSMLNQEVTHEVPLFCDILH